MERETTDGMSVVNGSVEELFAAAEQSVARRRDPSIWLAGGPGHEEEEET